MKTIEGVLWAVGFQLSAGLLGLVIYLGTL